MQLNLFNEMSNQVQWVNITNGEYLYVPNFFGSEEANRHFRVLLNDIEWKQESMNMYGKVIPFPRLTPWYGDNDKKTKDNVKGFDWIDVEEIR
jgi:hypothetical protein